MIETAIREAMGRQRVSLSRLARDAHIQRATLYAWFAGQRPEPDTWARVAERLQLPPLATVLAPRQDDGDIAAALRELARDISSLVGVLAPLTSQANDSTEARLRAVEAELALRAPEGGAGSRVRSAPRQKGG